MDRKTENYEVGHMNIVDSEENVTNTNIEEKSRIDIKVANITQNKVRNFPSRCFIVA